MKASNLKEAVACLEPTQSLDFSLNSSRGPWYVDPIESPYPFIKSHLLHVPSNSKVLFTGHTGSGITSTLNRLAFDAEILSNFFVTQFSVWKELDISDLGYVDLLVALGLRLYEDARAKLALNEKLKKDLDRWSTEVTEVWTKTELAGLEVEAGIHALLLKAKGLLSSKYEKKKEFRQRLEPRVPRLLELIDSIILSIEQHPRAGGRRVLVILDDLDKPRDQIALDLILDNASILTKPLCKMILTAPTSLLFAPLAYADRYADRYKVMRAFFNEFFMLPNFKITEKSGSPNPAALARMHDIVKRRIDASLIDTEALKLAVRMSGGVVKDLVRIVQGAATRALVDNVNFIGVGHVEQVINALQGQFNFGLLRQDYVDILREVHRNKQLKSDNETAALNLVHNLFILWYPNGPGWCDVNPVVHDLIGV
jgi:hypothetical protein